MESSSSLPKLTIITGRPGSGKTTLARKLADYLHCPHLNRDTIKQGMVNTTGDKGSPDGALAVEAYHTFFAAVVLLLTRGVTIVVDAHFGKSGWDPYIEQLKTLSRVKMIVCEVSLEVAQVRLNRRPQEDPRWDVFHNQPVDQSQRPAENYHPPNLQVPTLLVDTTDGYAPELPNIYEFADARE